MAENILPNVILQYAQKPEQLVNARFQCEFKPDSGKQVKIKCTVNTRKPKRFDKLWHPLRRRNSSPSIASIGKLSSSDCRNSPHSVSPKPTQFTTSSSTSSSEYLETFDEFANGGNPDSQYYANRITQGIYSPNGRQNRCLSCGSLGESLIDSDNRNQPLTRGDGNDFGAAYNDGSPRTDSLIGHDKELSNRRRELVDLRRRITELNHIYEEVYETTRKQPCSIPEGIAQRRDTVPPSNPRFTNEQARSTNHSVAPDSRSTNHSVAPVSIEQTSDCTKHLVPSMPYYSQVHRDRVIQSTDELSKASNNGHSNLETGTRHDLPDVSYYEQIQSDDVPASIDGLSNGQSHLKRNLSLQSVSRDTAYDTGSTVAPVSLEQASECTKHLVPSMPYYSQVHRDRVIASTDELSKASNDGHSNRETGTRDDLPDVSYYEQIQSDDVPASIDGLSNGQSHLKRNLSLQSVSRDTAYDTGSTDALPAMPYYFQINPPTYSRKRFPSSWKSLADLRETSIWDEERVVPYATGSRVRNGDGRIDTCKSRDQDDDVNQETSLRDNQRFSPYENWVEHGDEHLDTCKVSRVQDGVQDDEDIRETELCNNQKVALYTNHIGVKQRDDHVATCSTSYDDDVIYEVYSNSDERSFTNTENEANRFTSGKQEPSHRNAEGAYENLMIECSNLIDELQSDMRRDESHPTKVEQSDMLQIPPNIAGYVTLTKASQTPIYSNIAIDNGREKEMGVYDGRVNVTNVLDLTKALPAAPVYSNITVDNGHGKKKGVFDLTRASPAPVYSNITLANSRAKETDVLETDPFDFSALKNCIETFV